MSTTLINFLQTSKNDWYPIPKLKFMREVNTKLSCNFLDYIAIQSIKAFPRNKDYSVSHALISDCIKKKIKVVLCQRHGKRTKLSRII